MIDPLPYSMLSLSATDLPTFVAAHRARTGPWFFHHIPKTAGSSLASEIQEGVGNYTNLVPEYSGGATGYEQSFVRLTEEAIAALQGPNPPRAFSGHLRAHHAVRFAEAVPGLRSFTFLRHPVARVLSEYNYCRTPAHPLMDEFIERFPTLEHYISVKTEMNKASRMMFGPMTETITPEDAVAEMNRRYVMVGLQERYPVSFLLLSTLVWEPSLPKKHLRVGVKTAQLPDAIVGRILEANPIDLALYDAVDAAYKRLAPTIWDSYRPNNSA